MAKQVTQQEIDAAYEEEQEINDGMLSKEEIDAMYAEALAQGTAKEPNLDNVEIHEPETHVTSQEELQAYYGSLQEELDDAKGESRMYMGRAEDYIAEKYGKQSLEFEAHEDAEETVADAFDEVEDDAKKALEQALKEEREKNEKLVLENQKLMSLIDSKNKIIEQQPTKEYVDNAIMQSKFGYKIKQKFKTFKDNIIAIKDHTKQYAVDVKDDVFKSVDNLSVKVVQSSIDKNEKIANIERKTIRELETEKNKLIDIAEKEKQRIRELSLEQGKAKQGFMNMVRLTFHRQADHSQVADFSPKAKKKIAAIDSQLKDVVDDLNGQIKEASLRLREREGIIAEKQEYIDGISQYWQEKKQERDSRGPSVEEQIKTMTEKVHAENEKNLQQNPNRQKNHDDVEH